MPKNSRKVAISKELLDVLACPLCRAGLVHAKGGKVLACVKCGEEYAVREGILRLLPPK